VESQWLKTVKSLDQENCQTCYWEREVHNWLPHPDLPPFAACAVKMVALQDHWVEQILDTKADIDVDVTNIIL